MYPRPDAPGSAAAQGFAPVARPAPSAGLGPAAKIDARVVMASLDNNLQALPPHAEVRRHIFQVKDKGKTL
jgi:hypothetical protein